MPIRYFALLAGLMWAAPLAAQQAEPGPPPPASAPVGMERVLALRAAELE